MLRLTYFFSGELQYGCERCIIGNSDTKNITLLVPFLIMKLNGSKRIPDHSFSVLFASIKSKEYSFDRLKNILLHSKLF